MKSQTPNLLEWVTLKPLETVPRVIAVATILAAFITPSPAIIVHSVAAGSTPCSKGGPLDFKSWAKLVAEYLSRREYLQPVAAS